MKQSKVSLDYERALIINLITSKDFCKTIVPILNIKILKTKYAQIVAQWVKDYYTTYEDAPGALIQQIFHDRKHSLNNDELVDSISEFLLSISKKFDEDGIINVEYNIEQGIKYLKIRSLELHKEKIEEAIILDDPIKGEAAISDFSRIGKPSGEGASILHDAGAIIDAFTLENEYLFTFPGALKQTIGSPMRGDLIAYLGKPKGKKSWALQFTAETAMSYGCKVAFITLEMRLPQIIRRAWQSLNACPSMPMTVSVPYFDIVSKGQTEDEDIYTVENKITEKKPVDLTDVKHFQSMMKRKFRGGDIRYVAFPAYSATVEDIIAHLDVMEHFDNYAPDVVIIDYADLIKAGKNAGTEYRHQLDYVWKALRALAQSKNILVVTASQSNRSGLSGDLTLEHIAEDVRKLAHVSMLIALNQSKIEKTKNIMRMSTLLKRDDAANSADEASILQQLSIGKFYLDSRFTKNVERLDDH